MKRGDHVQLRRRVSFPFAESGRKVTFETAHQWRIASMDGRKVRLRDANGVVICVARSLVREGSEVGR